MNTINRAQYGNGSMPQSERPYKNMLYDNMDEEKTMRDLLKESIGQYVVTESLVGTNGLVSKEGVLVRVESNVYVLYQESKGTYTTGDYYSLKFFHSMPDPDQGQMNSDGMQMQNIRAGYRK